jgi:hypothetical protein
MKLEEVSTDRAATRQGSRALTLLAWLVIAVFVGTIIVDFYYGAVVMNNPPSFASKRFVFFWLAIFPLIFALFAYTFYLAWTTRKPTRLIRLWERAVDWIPLWIRLPIGLLTLVFPSYLYLFSDVGNWPLGYWARLGTLIGSALFCTLFVFHNKTWSGFFLRLSGVILVSGAIFTASGWLNQVTSYPFSLTWSEGNRFWDYSVLFGSTRYTLYPGSSLLRPYISIGRQVLWAIPFLFPNSSIWFMRFWDGLTWILPEALLALAVVVGLPGGWKSWVWKSIFILWVFVFLAQGPIYAPLVVCAILVVLAVRIRSLPVSILLIVISAYYANISRWTWMYAPGLWVGMVSLLDVVDPSLRRKGWKNLIRPVTLGLAGYVGAQFVPKAITFLQTANLPKSLTLVVDISSSIDRQPLLWDRLLPNPTYAPGILLGTVWAALPLLGFLFWVYASKLWRKNILQTLVMVTVSAAFLGVGTVISVKIGGGSNLHNLDMFWISLVLIAGWAVRDLARRGWLPTNSDAICVLLLCLAFIGPITYNVQYGHPLTKYDPYAVQDVLKEVRSEVTLASQHGQVLFIDQRQLLAFGYITGVPLAPEYEKKLMMDQAMAGNADYFKPFDKDVSAKRFALIVVEPIHISERNSDENGFANENNAWVEWVSRPLLDSYEPYKNYTQFGIQLLVPKK